MEHFQPTLLRSSLHCPLGLSIQSNLTVINLTASKGPHKGGCGVLIAGMIKCFPVSNIAVICYKQAFELYTNWSGHYQLLWHFILILKINLETGKKVQNYCFKQLVRAYLQSDRGSIVFRETAHFTGIKVSGLGCMAALSQFPTWAQRFTGSRALTAPLPRPPALSSCLYEDCPLHPKAPNTFSEAI